MALSISPRGIAFGPVLKGKILASVERLNGSSTSLAAVALNCWVLTKEDIVMMSAVRTLHH